jgi:nitrate/nitrite transport system ATP-binding protein
VDEAVLLSDRIVMKTNGPAAHIGEILEIELPRPRDRLALATHPRYIEYGARCWRSCTSARRRPAA